MRSIISLRTLYIVLGIIGIVQCLFSLAFAVTLFQFPTKAESLIVINYDNAFIAERAKEYDLAQIILQYDPVIYAIEKYYKDEGIYPLSLSALVPKYLSKVPSIYIRNGERLVYLTEPLTQHSSVTPFTFYIYGHYSGFASMHGWFLYYCPITFDGCNNKGDRHVSMYRINDRWVWINSSAL